LRVIDTFQRDSAAAASTSTSPSEGEPCYASTTIASADGPVVFRTVSSDPPVEPTNSGTLNPDSSDDLLRVIDTFQRDGAAAASTSTSPGEGEPCYASTTIASADGPAEFRTLTSDPLVEPTDSRTLNPDSSDDLLRVIDTFQRDGAAAASTTTSPSEGEQCYASATIESADHA
jgi:hypothetical protein